MSLGVTGEGEIKIKKKHTKIKTPEKSVIVSRSTVQTRNFVGFSRTALASAQTRVRASRAESDTDVRNYDDCDRRPVGCARAAVHTTQLLPVAAPDRAHVDRPGACARWSPHPDMCPDRLPSGVLTWGGENHDGDRPPSCRHPKSFFLQRLQAFFFLIN